MAEDFDIPFDSQLPTLNIPPITIHHIKPSRSTRSLTWLEASFASAKGEKSLWIAVITQALQDALTRCKKSESQYHKYEAIHWLTSNGKDFVTVCLAADMDPDYVRRKAKNIIAAPSPWRAEAGKGKRYLERKAYRKRQAEIAAHFAKKLEEEHLIIQGPWAEK